MSDVPVPRPDLAGPTLAAIDLGSNSFRLELGVLQRGRYRRLDYLKETVRLGGGLDAEGCLTEEAQQRGLDCLTRFGLRLRGLPPERLRAVATQTLREARNRDAFLARAEAVLGHPIEVISGREEARLIFAGVARLQPGERPRLVIDIGGRSTEMILGQGRVPRVVESFKIGSVSLSMQYFPDGVFTPAAFRAAQVAAGAEFEEALTLFTPDQWVEALGSSGTVGAVAQLLSAHGVSDGTITPAGLRWCIERCLEAGRVEALDLPGLKPERRAVLGGGLSILYTLAMQFGIDALQPARGALRQGVIVDLADRLEARSRPGERRRAADPREVSVAEMQRRFGVDLAQAERVRRLALRLHAALEPAAGEADEAVLELGWAAALHEIGMFVSHHDHHRHSAYLLAHVDAPGFSQSQLRRVAALVLGHRGDLRKLEHLDREAVTVRVLALRLAALLCHARVDPPAEGCLHLERRRGGALLRLEAGWAGDHPRTLHLLGEEVQAWARGGPWRLCVEGG